MKRTRIQNTAIAVLENHLGDKSERGLGQRELGEANALHQMEAYQRFQRSRICRACIARAGYCGQHGVTYAA